MSFSSGPCTLDLGWYLAVNAGRLARTKEEVLSRYRALLEQALVRRIPDLTWQQLVRVAVLAGARLLLWAKALALADSSVRAFREWDWWLEALDCHVLPELERMGSAGPSFR
jgi:hypothetical protein